MFSRKKSPVKKKFALGIVAKKRRRALDPRTVLLLQQAVLGLVLAGVCALLVAVVWYGTRVPFLTLTTVTVTGGETIDRGRIEADVQRLLDGQYIGLIPRRFAWLYPEDAVLAAVAAVPRVKDPVVERVSGTELVVSFAEYVPYALWCADRTSTACVFIDGDGYAFSSAPTLRGGAFPRFHTIGSEPQVGTEMLPLSDLRAIEQLREQISKESALPIAFVETDMMRDVFLGVAGGGEIRATLRMSPVETFENLRTILSSPQFADLAPGAFQYVDLRFGNKIFVNEEPLAVATSTASTSTASTTAAADTTTPTDVPAMTVPATTTATTSD